MKSVQPKHQRLFNQSQPQTDWKASGCLQFQPDANLGQGKVTPGRCRCCCGAQTDGCQDKHVSRITARGWISTKPSGLLADVGSGGGSTLPIHIMHMEYRQGRWCTLPVFIIHNYGISSTSVVYTSHPYHAYGISSRSVVYTFHPHHTCGTSLQDR